MPQIGWFEILIVVILAVLIVGPKDFPIMVKKIGSWFGSFKRYINEVQSNVNDLTEVDEYNDSNEQILKEKQKNINNDEK